MSLKHPTPHCRDLLAQLPDYIDGELEAAICAEFEKHLAGCDDCRIVVDTTRKTVFLYQRQGQVELPNGAVERLWQALESEGCLSSTQ